MGGSTVSPKTLIVCMFIPPSCREAYQQEAIHYLNSLSTDRDIIVLGDFNAPDIDWPALPLTTPTPCVTLYTTKT